MKSGVNTLIVVPISRHLEGRLRDAMMDSTSTFRELSLYGRRVFVVDPFPKNSMVISPEEAMLIDGGLYARGLKPEGTIVDVNGIQIGGKRLVIAAGPCAVESEEQVMTVAESVKKLGADMLRGGAFKPRTSPYSFQGLGAEGLRLLRKASDATGLPVVSEIMDLADYPLFDQDVDMLQIGSRNSQNFSMLRNLGRTEKPILLKNGMGNTVSEWLNSAEYLLSGGNGNIVMCYRGTRGFEEGTRFTMDSGVIPVMRKRTHLPICADPSHPAGNRAYVESLTLAAVASGADMIEIEVHNDPDNALSDSSQQLTFEEFSRLSGNARKLSEFLR